MKADMQLKEEKLPSSCTQYAMMKLHVIFLWLTNNINAITLRPHESTKEVRTAEEAVRS